MNDKKRKPSVPAQARGPGAKRSRATAALGLIAILAVAALAWRAIPTTDPSSSTSPSSLTDRVLGWYLDQRSELLMPVDAEDREVSFEVAPGESLDTVASRLQQEGLVRDAGAFGLLARLTGKDKGVQAGSHVLRTTMSAREVLDALQTAYQKGNVVTIPEGWRAEETAAFLEAAGVVSATTFSDLVSDAAGSRDLAPVASRPDTAGLEGFLFPDTYEFGPDASAEEVLGRFLANFADRWSAEQGTAGGAQGLNAFEVVTLASIVEREAMAPEERGKIARVFLNRLATPPRLLDADPTVQFALGFQPDIQSWWKRPLTAEDLAVASAYNTYVTPGLPPGPIASPGMASIRGVLEAPPGDWLYFVLDGAACDGTHRFTASYSEHLANVEAYRSSGCER